MLQKAYNACLNVAPSPDKVGHITFKLHHILFCICMFVPEKGRNLGYIYGTLCVCVREGVELWLYPRLCVCAREGVELWLYSRLVFCAKEGEELCLYIS